MIKRKRPRDTEREREKTTIINVALQNNVYSESLSVTSKHYNLSILEHHKAMSMQQIGIGEQ